MQIKYIALDKLLINDGQITGLPKNPRTIDVTHFHRLKESIIADPEMLELRELIVYPYEDKYLVIGGNMRLQALRELEFSEAPCKVIDIEVPVEKLKAYLIKDNVTGGEWDYSLLANEWEIEELQDWGLDLPLDFHINEDIEEEEHFTDDDAIPQVVESKSKNGDIWILGNHRLMCGDSTSLDAVEKLMNGNKAQMVFTDPPYGVGYSARTGLRSGIIRDNMQMIMNDDLNKDELLVFLTDILNNIIIVSEINAPFYVCNNWHCVDVFMAAFKACSLDINAWIIWNKQWMSLGHGHYRNNHEFIFYSQRNAESYAQKGTQQDVWSIQKLAPTAKIHTTEKPVDLIDIALTNSSKPNDHVLDLFGGSGSTLIACEKTKRINYSMELDPKYCDIIITRWQNYTKKDAILESTKQKYNEI